VQYPTQITGKIFYIKDKKITTKGNVLQSWQRTLFLKDEKDTSSKAWLLDIMNCIDALGTKEFSLPELYSFEKDLAERHPNNKHIKDKIRQQLQFLRDKDYLDFVSRGTYSLSQNKYRSPSL
jgi:type II restriction enzyme